MSGFEHQQSGVHGTTKLPDGGLQRWGDSVTCVVVVPTFNHGSVVPAVLQALEHQQLPILVVDDGSTDSTEAYLSEWSSSGDPTLCKVVVRHQRNMGKAAAICTGLEKALELGYTHAATIDADGQHDVIDLCNLLDYAAGHHDAVVVGARIHGQDRVPFKSRIGRVLTNALVWIESGVRVCDSQSGMRVYAIASTLALGVRASRYGFETEVLVRAGWNDISVAEHSIQCIYDPPGGRATHFKVWGDTVSAVGMHIALLVRALGPNLVDKGRQGTGTIPRRLGRWFSPRALGRMGSGDAEARHRFAASIGVGLLMATLPIYGLKTVLCVWIAAHFKLHPLAIIAVSSLSTPPIGFVFVAYAICIGSLVLGGALPDFSALDFSTIAQWATAGDLLLEWVVGGVIGGLVLGGASYALIRPVLAWRVKRRTTV